MLHWRTSLSRDGKKMLTRHYLISRAWLVPFTLTRQRAGVGQAREDGRATRQAMGPGIQSQGEHYVASFVQGESCQVYRV